jgi:hypothetical protein
LVWALVRAVEFDAERNLPEAVDENEQAEQ